MGLGNVKDLIKDLADFDNDTTVKCIRPTVGRLSRSVKRMLPQVTIELLRRIKFRMERKIDQR